MLHLTLGTATSGISFPAFGSAFVAAVWAGDPGVTIEPRITKGSTENLTLVRVGKLDFALLQGECAYAALTG